MKFVFYIDCVTLSQAFHVLSLGLPDGDVPAGSTTDSDRHVAAAKGLPSVFTAINAAAVLDSAVRPLFWTVAPRVHALRFSSYLLSQLCSAPPSLHLLDAERCRTPGLSSCASSLFIRKHSQVTQCRVVWMWFGAFPGAFGRGRAQPQRRGTSP